MTLTPAELRVLLSLLLRLGIEGYEIVSLMRQHGVSEAQIAEADLDNEISVYDRIKQLQTN